MLLLSCNKYGGKVDIEAVDVRRPAIKLALPAQVAKVPPVPQVAQVQALHEGGSMPS